MSEDDGKSEDFHGSSSIARRKHRRLWARRWVFPMASVRGKGAARSPRAVVQWIEKRLPFFFWGGYFVMFLTFPLPLGLIILASFLSTWSDLDYVDSLSTVGSSANRRQLHIREWLQEYLFGGGRAAERLKRLRLSAVISFLRRHKGSISPAEIMALTGQTPENAREYLDELVVAYSGEPMVTSSGTVIYHFSGLDSAPGWRSWDGPAALVSSTSDGRAKRDDISKKKTRLVNLANWTNLLFAAYYGGNSLRLLLRGAAGGRSVSSIHSGIPLLFQAVYGTLASVHLAPALPLMFLVLGVIPFGISCAFFALHFIARRRKAVLAATEEEEIVRRQVYGEAISHPETVDPDNLRLDDRARPERISAQSVAEALDELAAHYHADIEDAGDGHYVYHFPELEIEIQDVEGWRGAPGPSEPNTGRIVFDSRTWLNRQDDTGTHRSGE